MKDKGLLKLFLVVSTGAVVLTSLNLFVLYPRFTVTLVSQTEEVAVRLASHLSSATIGQRGGKITLNDLWDVLAGNKIKAIQKDLKIVKLKVFLPSGETLYSTSPEDIGEINQKSYFHEIVAKGNPYTKVVKNEKNVEGQTVTADVVKTSVPIMVNGGFAGVFEIYLDITEHLAILHRLSTFSSVLSIGSMGFFLILILAGMLRLDRKIIENQEANEELDRLASDLSKKNIEIDEKRRELQKAYEELQKTQSQMLQREKMASVGQLAAGVAHEINNPMGFITGNIGALKKYMKKFVEFIEIQAEMLASLGAEDRVKEAREKLKLDFLIKDINDLLQESTEGARRVTEIVRNLKSFSRLDEAVVALADINECIETTLKIIRNELKYTTTIHKEYGELPLTLCNAQELNQVFMNILMNAAQAIEKQGDITIRTRHESDVIRVSISDNGSGIEPDKLGRIFEPFFTTKVVGKGTGLGLSICYDIVKKHGGEITVESEVGKGTTFTVGLPVKDGTSQATVNSQ